MKVKQAYKRIMALGDDRVLQINNALARGESTVFVARLIQQEWGEFQDVAEKTLIQQISRYKMDNVDSVAQSKSVVIENKVRVHKRLDVLGEMIWLVKEQRGRIERFIAKEKTVQLPLGLNKEIETLHTMLKDVQKTQFDLGIDEFKGPLQQNGKAMGVSITTPNGTVVQAQIVDAVQTANSILDKHGVPSEAIEGEFSVGGE